MYFVFIFMLSSVSALKFGGPDFTAPFIQDLQGSKIDPIKGEVHATTVVEDLTVTVTTTRDVFETVTNKFWNSVPILVTEFSKSTLTLPTREVVRTPVDDLVRINTQVVTPFPVTETVTDVFSQHRLHTEVSTDPVTVTHLDQNILQTTITSVLVKTFTFRPTIVRTVIETELVKTTETEFFTSTAYSGRSFQKVFY